MKGAETIQGMNRIREYRKSHGTAYTLRRLGQKAAQKYLRTYERRREKEKCPEAELERQRRNQPAAGLFSVVIPVYNTDPRMLAELVAALESQTYRNFEALLYDGHSTRGETLEVLRRTEEKHSGREAGGPVFRVIHGEENLGISGNTNRAVALARGEWAVLCDHDDLITPDALWRVAECIVRTQPDLVYTDEDRISEDGSHHMDPHYKPDYCPDNLISDNYICHMAAVRKALLEEIGGLRSGFDGSQDHDLFLRVAEKTEKIEHVPYVLYSWREVFSSASHRDLQRCLESGCRAVEEHEAKRGLPVKARPVNREIRLWYEAPEDTEIRVLVYGESEAVCRECFEELKQRTGWAKLSAELIPLPGREQAWKRLNAAAREAREEMLLFLEAGVHGFSRDFLRELLMYARREDAAAASPALTDRRGRLVHGGYAAGVLGAAQCVNEGMYRAAGGWHDMMNKVHNVIACSPACMMIRRDHWIDLDEGYREGLAAVDQGLRQREAGRWTVWTPHAEAVFRKDAFFLNGTERNPEDLRRFEERWGKNVHDPCYSPRFDRRKASYRY